MDEPKMRIFFSDDFYEYLFPDEFYKKFDFAV